MGSMGTVDTTWVGQATDAIAGLSGTVYAIGGAIVGIAVAWAVVKVVRRMINRA